LLGDQPQVSTRLILSLVEQHSASLAPIVAPIVDGQRTNPVLFDCSTFSDLLDLSGDTGGRALFSRYTVQWMEWHDASALFDVDTPEDYRRLLEG
jgi:molybdenum cofactor cytidylyltransferase